VTIETEREEDGRWIAEVPDLPGVLVYSATRAGAISQAKAMALRVIADRLETGKKYPSSASYFPLPHDEMAVCQSA
jgi:predicted RNase H-like HicB family nuclease